MAIEEILGLSVPVVYLGMFATERIWPARKFPKIGWWGLVGFLFLVLMMTIGIIAPLLLPVEWLATHRLLDGTKLGVVGGTIVGFVVVELVVYAYHRACHSSSILWRGVHQMHHAPQRLDMPGATVFHPFELVLQNVLLIGTLVFVLGLEPLAAALVASIAGFYAMFQHWNVRTPRWLGYVIQRPESHCIHHQRNVHAKNYSDLPLVDMLFGTFENPATFEGEVGFEKASFAKMLVGVDVNAGAEAGQPGGALQRA
jgi:sterol desaturase/sphingolipid hydroxylase (fatty acid hydroxylase superfamily)